MTQDYEKPYIPPPRPKTLYEENKEFEERYWPDVQRILVSVAGLAATIKRASAEDDSRRATDIIIDTPQGQVGQRVRRDYPYRDFTLRAEIGSGNATEIDKIRAGYARWYIYCWTDNYKIVSWIFVDLDAVRASGMLNDGRRPIENKDNETAFTVYKQEELAKHGALLARMKPGDDITAYEDRRPQGKQLGFKMEAWEREAGVWYDKQGNPNIGHKAPGTVDYGFI